MLRLGQIYLSRCRGIREGTLSELADVNILIGRNNSGKTTIAEAIMRLGWMVTGKAGDGTGEAEKDLMECWSAPRNESELFPDEFWFEQDRNKEIVLTGIVRNRAYEVRMRGKPMQCSPTFSDPPDAVENERTIAFFKGIRAFRPKDGFDRTIEKRAWPELIAKRRDKTLTETLNDVFGLNAEGFQLLPDNRLFVLFHDQGLPLDSQGDGPRAAMRTLITLAVMNDTLLILEEPECHQHPGSLKKFAAAVCRQARKQQVQLVISTHSLECVQAFLGGAQAAESEAALFHLALTNGCLSAKRLDPTVAATLEDTGVDVRFLDLYG